MTPEEILSQRLQQRCLEKFEEWKPIFSAQFPGNRFDVYASDSGPSLCGEGRRILSFSVSRKVSPDALDIQFFFSKGQPSLTLRALLLWGDDVGHIELKLADEPIVLVGSLIAEQFDAILDLFKDRLVLCLVEGYCTERCTEVILEESSNAR